MNRRNACKLLGTAALAPAVPRAAVAQSFAIRYVLSSALYGDLPLDEVLGEVKRSGYGGIDIWRKGHATHREQIEEMGDEAFQ